MSAISEREGVEGEPSLDSACDIQLHFGSLRKFSG